LAIQAISSAFTERDECEFSDLPFLAPKFAENSTGKGISYALIDGN
jgi:hypothetical protein